MRPAVLDGRGLAEEVAEREIGAAPACCADDGGGRDVHGFHPVEFREGERGEEPFGHAGLAYGLCGGTEGERFFRDPPGFGEGEVEAFSL